MNVFLKTSIISVVFALGSLGISSDVLALDVYKCKDAHGKFNYTDNPCVGESQMISYSKMTEHPAQYEHQEVALKSERVAKSHRNKVSRSDVNVFAVNEKYDNQVRDVRFKYPRTSEQAVLNKNLDKIEKNRQRELKGM